LDFNIWQACQWFGWVAGVTPVSFRNRFSRSALMVYSDRIVMIAIAISERMAVQFMMNLLLKMIGKGEKVSGADQ